MSPYGDYTVAARGWVRLGVGHCDVHCAGRNQLKFGLFEDETALAGNRCIETLPKLSQLPQCQPIANFPTEYATSSWLQDLQVKRRMLNDMGENFCTFFILIASWMHATWHQDISNRITLHDTCFFYTMRSRAFILHQMAPAPDMLVIFFLLLQVFER